MNYNTYKYKKDLILSKLMEENIPDNNSIKKYLDKDKVDFNIKPEDKEHIFLECFKDLNNTLSKEGRQRIINDIIYDLCHNLIDIEDAKNFV